MATRSMIGRFDENNRIVGRYVHWDGYPSGVGQTLHKAFAKHFGGSAEIMATYFIDEHPAGWSSVMNADFSLPAGFREVDDKPSPFIFSSSGEPISNPNYVNQPECYCHGSRQEPEDTLICNCGEGDNSGCQPLSIEYIYGLAEEGLHIYYHVEVAGEFDPPYEGTNYRPPKYCHVLYGILPWDQPVDWAQVEEDIAESRDAAYERSRA